jgi:hypothetical protein
MKIRCSASLEAGARLVLGFFRQFSSAAEPSGQSSNSKDRVEKEIWSKRRPGITLSSVAETVGRTVIGDIVPLTESVCVLGF